MADNLVHALLQEISWGQEQMVQDGKKKVPVQFNPDSLKLAFSNQSASGDQRGGSATQHVGSGSTKLTFDLWFDITNPEHLPPGAPPGAAQDVRKLTEDVAFFMIPRKGSDGKVVPPGVRFLWGTFLFEGVMESLSESLEYFSPDGRPLRSKISVSLSKQEIRFEFGKQQGGGLGTTGTPKQTQTAKAGDSVAGMVGKNGSSDGWQSAAAANGIENPRNLAPGTRIDTSASLGLSGGLGGGMAIGGGISGGIGAGASVGIGLSAGAGVSAGASVGAGASLGAGAGLSAGASLGAGVSAGAGAALGGGLRAGAAASAGAGAGIGGGVGGGIGGGIGGGLGGGIGGGISGGFGAGISGGAGIGVGGSLGAGVSGGIGGGGISAGISGGISGGGAAASASARASASFDARLRR